MTVGKWENLAGTTAVAFAIGFASAATGSVRLSTTGSIKGLSGATDIVVASIAAGVITYGDAVNNGLVFNTKTAGTIVDKINSVTIMTVEATKVTVAAGINLSVGVAAPLARLDVDGGAIATDNTASLFRSDLSAANAFGANITVGNNGAAASAMRIGFVDMSVAGGTLGTGTAQVESAYLTGSQGGYMALKTRQAQTLGMNTRVYLDSLGRVGVGTGSGALTGTLQVAQTSLAQGALLSSVGTAVTGAAGSLFLSILHVGDFVTATETGQTVSVAAVIDDTHFTSSPAFSPALTGISGYTLNPQYSLNVASGTAFFASTVFCNAFDSATVSDVTFKRNNVLIATLQSAGVLLSVAGLTFAAGVALPTISQTIAAAGAGAAMAITGQAAAVGSGLAGATVTISGGAGDGAGAAGSSVLASGTTRVSCTSTLVQLLAGSVAFNVTTSAIGWSGVNTLSWSRTTTTPTLTQDINTTDITTHALLIVAQSAYATASGTNLNGAALVLQGGGPGVADTAGNNLRGGVQLKLGFKAPQTALVMLEIAELVNASTAANQRRVVSLCRTTAITSTELPVGSGDLVVYIGNVGQAPTGTVGQRPVNGGTLYAEAGAGKWCGTSGTITTFGPAEPHCPRCGMDYSVEHENAAYATRPYFAACWHCLANALTRAGIDESEYMIPRKAA